MNSWSIYTPTSFMIFDLQFRIDLFNVILVQLDHSQFNKENKHQRSFLQVTFTTRRSGARIDRHDRHRPGNQLLAARRYDALKYK